MGVPLNARGPKEVAGKSRRQDGLFLLAIPVELVLVGGWVWSIFGRPYPVPYITLPAHETLLAPGCRLLLVKKTKATCIGS
ncbi:MAG TPA: hypothetical protein DEP42_06785, partial [Ruminococcaceae bacterium]|nr:hypothetical protein [Oscillospiraceae bacterium]